MADTSFRFSSQPTRREVAASGVMARAAAQPSDQPDAGGGFGDPDRQGTRHALILDPPYDAP